MQRLLGLFVLGSLVFGVIVARAGVEEVAAGVAQFVVVGPDPGSSAPEQIYLAAAQDGWNPAGRVAPAVAPGLYVLRMELPAGSWFEYKYTRSGAWATVEKAGDGSELPNRRVRVPSDVREFVVVDCVARWADRTPAAERRVAGPAQPTATSQPSTRTGDIRTHEHVRAAAFDNERAVHVWLPPEYAEDRDRRYPVVYLLDGRNMFDASSSFSGVEWQADETAARLIGAGRIEPVILVAVENTAERFAEYTPRADARHGGGRADEFLAFIAQTVKPLVDSTYRTRPAPRDTAIVGSSVAGVLAAYAPCARPELFGRAIVLDPSLWWADGALMAYVREHPAPRTARVWLSLGIGPADSGDPGPLGRQLVEFSRALAGANAEVRYQLVPGAEHHERDWAGVFDDALEFLFPAGPTSRPLAE